MCFRYLTSNAKLSTCVVDTLLPEIPSYLHNRPHWFVRHCISRMCNAEELAPATVGQLTDDAFQVVLNVIGKLEDEARDIYFCVMF